MGAGIKPKTPKSDVRCLVGCCGSLPPAKRALLAHPMGTSCLHVIEENAEEERVRVEKW